MAEDEGAKSKKSFKSKWGRVFKEKEAHEVPADAKHTNSFKLNDEVADFLKPSTEKAAARAANLAPKIDIAIAQRWPDANQVKQVNGAGTAGWSATTPGGLNGFTKPTRRPGLQVGFARTPPEVMGEGGDECIEPVLEVGKRKAVRGRSVSDARQIPAMANVAAAAMARQGSGRDDGFAKPPMRRTQTSGEEFTPNIQRQQYSPPSMYAQPEFGQPDSRGLDFQPAARPAPAQRDGNSAIPRITTDLLQPTSTGQGPPSARSPGFDQTAERRRSIRASEGMALRRASAMIVDDDNTDEDRRTSVNFGIRPPPQLYETLSREDAENVMPEVLEPATSPESARSLNGPSPFADPKYMKRHSREVTPDENPIHEPPAVQSLRQPRQSYQPSYMRTAPADNSSAAHAPSQQNFSRHPIPQVSSPQDPVASREHAYDYQSSLRAPQPVQSQVRPIPQVQPPVADDLADDRFRPPPSMQSPSEIAAPRPPPGYSQSMNVPQLPIRERSRSPLHDRMFDNIGVSDQPGDVYQRQNVSNTSVNHSMHSPRFQHSRTNSHDSARAMNIETDHRRQMSPRLQQHSQSPQHSPRSSMLAQTTSTSPHGRGPSPGSTHPTYIAAQRGLAQAPRSPANPQEHQSGSRPSSSAASNAPFAVPKSTGSPTSRLPVFRNQQSGSRPSSVASIGSLGQGYHSPPQQGQPFARPGAGYLSEADTQRPGSSGSAGRPAVSPQPPVDGNPQADLAFADFATRVAHMKGVFRLTAEKERAADRCAPNDWLRTALWWYGRGKAGLEAMLQQRSTGGQIRERLEQPHVDLAKAWWILTDPLEPYDDFEANSPQSAASSRSPDIVLKHSVSILKCHLKSLSFSMGKNQLMPPPQSLIQGQDTTIWLEYPRFTPDAAAALGSNWSYNQAQAITQAPLDALPLSDTSETFCYGRFLVDVSMNTDEAETDRVGMTCNMTMLRGKRDFATTIVIASQRDLVNIRISPRQSDRQSTSWQDVAWKGQSSMLVIRLPNGFEATIRMHERDFRTLWKLAEYARKVEYNLRTAPGEVLVHEAHLAEMQYVDPSGQNSFPAGKVKEARALVFQRHAEERDGGGTRKVHRGNRLVLLTEPTHKSLSSVSHDVGHDGPIFFEMITDSAAGGMAALVLRIGHEQRQCRALLVFPDVQRRQALYDVINGLAVGREEQIVGKMNLASLNVEPATSYEGFAQKLHPALRSLQWLKLGVTNGIPEDSHARQMPTVMSESLRVLAQHASGCITDRLNLSKGEMLLRLPCGEVPAIQILRGAQEDLTMSIDTRHSPPGIADGITQLHDLVRQRQTIRTLHFTTHAELHAFQEAVTGCSVRYDGLAASFGIKRRMMYVPIHQKWEASTVRLQVVARGPNLVQVLAFMEDFAHADAMCFQVKSTDTFEAVKGDGKGKKWAVRLVEAKFSLPPPLEKEKKDKEGDASPRPLEGEALEARVRRRFVNLEGLEYMNEHDDITVGFETQEERDRFAATLPAAATMGRGITLKRRI